MYLFYNFVIYYNFTSNWISFFKWFYFEVKSSVLKWNEVSYGEVPEDKIAMYIRVTLYWGYLIVLWLFHLVCTLYCGCFKLFCNVWVCVCVGFVNCGCFGNMCTCTYCVLYYFYCVFVLFRLCIFILICFVCTSVRTTATEWKLNCNNNNNNNMWMVSFTPQPFYSQ